jgi:hypothetical protein
LVSVWDFKAGKPLFETHADKDENWGWALVEYSPDGQYILSRTMLQWPDITDANKIYMFDSQKRRDRAQIGNRQRHALIDGWLVAGWAAGCSG